MATLANFYSATYWSSYNFLGSAWLIPIVVLGYFIVIVLDNLLVWHTNKTVAKLTSSGRRGKDGSLDSTDNGSEEHGRPTEEGDVGQAV